MKKTKKQKEIESLKRLLENTDKKDLKKAIEEKIKKLEDNEIVTK